MFLLKKTLGNYFLFSLSAPFVICFQWSYFPFWPFHYEVKTENLHRIDARCLNGLILMSKSPASNMWYPWKLIRLLEETHHPVINIYASYMMVVLQFYSQTENIHILHTNFAVWPFIIRYRLLRIKDILAALNIVWI